MMLSIADSKVYSISELTSIQLYSHSNTPTHPHTLSKAWHTANLSTTKPQHGLTWDGTQAFAVSGRPLTAWAMAQTPCFLLAMLTVNCQ